MYEHGDDLYIYAFYYKRFMQRRAGSGKKANALMLKSY